MKKRLLSLVLAVAMVMSMVAMPVWAWGTKDNDIAVLTDSCPCGCGQTLDEVEWKPWNVNEDGNPSQGHYSLDGNYTQNEEVTIISGFNVVLDLRGYTLTTAKECRVATVQGAFTVVDTVGGGLLSAMISSGATGGVIKVEVYETADPVFTLHSGTITPDPNSTKTAGYGGLVSAQTGSIFNMTGGTLLGGTVSSSGGAVYAINSTVNITGGSIIGNTSGNSGGSLYATGATVNLEDCQFIGGTATGWGGHIYLTGEAASLAAENCSFEHGVAKCTGASENNNGGGNICCLTSSTSSFTNCTFTGGYTAKNGGNLFLGSGKHTLTGCTIDSGTGGYNGNNIYAVGNVTLDGCTIAGDMEYNSSANTLTLKGANRIGLLNTGLNIIKTDTTVDVSGLTTGAEIYLNADGVTLPNANMDYFKPAIRTVLTQVGTSIAAAYAADGEIAGYCPHCNAKVAWTPLVSSSLANTSGHYYYTADTNQTSQLRVGNNDNSIAVDAVVDLNGCDINCSGRFAYIYSKAGNTTLTVLDSAGTSTVTGKGVTSSYFQNGGVIYNEKNLNIYGGKFVVDHDTSRGINNGGVVFNGGAFNMYGGVLDGGAYNQTTAVNLSGATVNCYGGALYMGAGSSRKFNMSAGHIIGGTASEGGAIALNYNNVVNITGGSITGGKAAVRGGNLAFYYADDLAADRRKADITIENCAITDGRLETSSTAAGGGNIYVVYGDLDMQNCYVADGYSVKYGGNFSVGSSTVNLTDTILLEGTADTYGGNLHAASTSCTVNLTGCMLTRGSADTYGGNLSAGNGYVTITGGEISYGKAGSYGGNIRANTGITSSVNYLRIQADTDGNIPLIAGGRAATYGGNMHQTGTVYLDAALITGGRAETMGQDIYAVGTNTFTIGEGLTGNILMGTEEALLGDPVYGNPIASTVCETLKASIYLENEGYGQPMLIAENGTLCVGAVGVTDADGNGQWFTSADDAVAAYTPGSILRLATDCELTLTQNCIIDLCGNTVIIHGNYTVAGMDSANDNYTLSEGKLIFADLETTNTEAITPVSTGSMYVAITEGNTATFHRLDFGIKAISIRPRNCGIYYNSVWSGDSVVAQKVDAFGVALSLGSMPTADFRSDDTCMYTVSEEVFAAGTNDTSVLISGIMQNGDTYGDEAQTPVSAETNSKRGKMPIYATAYITVNGVTYIDDDSTTEDDNVDYSLYSAMELMDELITNNPEQFRRYCNAVRNFYDIWDEYGMENWEFDSIYIPEEDDVIDLLMIGSSGCYYYVEEMAALAHAAGKKLRVCNVYYSGCKLYQHYEWWVAGEKNYQFFDTTVDENGKVTRKKTTPVSLEWCLAQGDWDVISLMEGTSYMIRTGDVAAHWEGAKGYLDALIPYLEEQFPDARLLWHQAWANQVGYSGNGYEVNSHDDQEYHSAYIDSFAQLVKKNYGLDVVVDGSAWMNVRNGMFGEAYDNLCARLASNGGLGDNSHDGDIGGGQFLNACVWFETITGIDCRDIDNYELTYTYSGTLPQSILDATFLEKVDGGYALTAEFIDLLQECAHAAVEAAKNQ